MDLPIQPSAPHDAYQAALHYLYSFIDYEKLPGASPKRMGLEKIEALVHTLGHPERRYPVVHITGTKGKGSTAAMMASILHHSGHRVGLYTSPHLVSFRERIMIDGEPIPKTDLCRMVETVRCAVETTASTPAGRPDTFFDVWTALAFAYFAQQQVDIAVVEVGLGGRLDSTNVVDPAVCLLTPIGLDHTDRLGNTIPEIAREKSGIIKAGVPVVVGPQDPEALSVIQETCRRQRSRLIRVGVDIRHTVRYADTERQVFDVQGIEGPYTGLEIPLLGSYQVDNALAAVGAAEALRQSGLPVSPEGLAEGLRTVRWPGRLQVVERRPWLILDGAHNALAARTLTSTLRRLFPYRRAVLILSLHQDKAVDVLCREFAAWADTIIVPGRRVLRRRQADPESVAALCRQMGVSVQVTEGVSDAIAMARVMAGPEDLICVSGCLALVGETMEVLGHLEPEEVLSRL
jgi:dihydrofolate synthase/folylpolyglutamate synthase